VNKRWIPGLVFVFALVVIGCVSAMRAESVATPSPAPKTATSRPTQAPTERPEPTWTPETEIGSSDATSSDATSSDATSSDTETSPGEISETEGEVEATESPTPPPEPVLPEGVIRGVVQDAGGPVADATVRVQLTDYETASAEDGSFVLKDLPMTEPVIVTAWAEDYYIGHSEGMPGLVPITITVKPHYQTDNLDYEWFEFDGVQGSASCAPCHPSYEEWKADAHGQSAVNPRFISMYEGTDVHGNQSPMTRFGGDGQIVPPDPDEYYGPGVKTDYPERDWNCAACHTPLADNRDPDDTCAWSGCHMGLTASRSDELEASVPATGMVDPNALDGIGCDFCHKIGDVIISSETGLPYPDRPGIMSMRLLRPEEGEQLFFGTFDDDIRRVTKLPLLEESEYCAPCHYGVFSGVVAPGEVAGGVVIYNSFGEWLNSPYSDPKTGETCQECHMPPTGENPYFVHPEKGGLIRDPHEITNHDMLGVTDVEFLQESVTMTTTAAVENGRVVANVDIYNDNTGHHVPTGAPQRHLILVVQAVDDQGNPLSLADGPILPEWTGNYAGQPGEAYAKVLRDEWSGEVPSAAYWRDVTLVSDNRIAAYETAETRYVFEAPTEGDVTVTAQLLFRRSFQELADLKGWDDPDITMASDEILLSR
jgi:hypothetical protein